jgi:hypothetical protein
MRGPCTFGSDQLRFSGAGLSPPPCPIHSQVVNARREAAARRPLDSGKIQRYTARPRTWTPVANDSVKTKDRVMTDRLAAAEGLVSQQQSVTEVTEGSAIQPGSAGVYARDHRDGLFA